MLEFMTCISHSILYYCLCYLKGAGKQNYHCPSTPWNWNHSLALPGWLNVYLPSHLTCTWLVRCLLLSWVLNPVLFTHTPLCLLPWEKTDYPRMVNGWLWGVGPRQQSVKRSVHLQPLTSDLGLFKRWFVFPQTQLLFRNDNKDHGPFFYPSSSLLSPHLPPPPVRLSALMSRCGMESVAISHLSLNSVTFPCACETQALWCHFLLDQTQTSLSLDLFL